MISYYKKIAIFKVKQYWFAYKGGLSNLFALNAGYHIKQQNTPLFAVKDVTHTLELDLHQPEDQIIANFSKQIRQQMKIAAAENTTCYFHKEVDTFVTFFNDFANQKNTFTITTEEILSLGNQVALSFAVNNEQILAAHSYLIDKDADIVRHLHSATKRLDANADRNLIGRGNKYLTVTDILYFKEQGYATFDFGGYAKDTEDESLKGINNYKSLFGGKLVECIDYYSYGYWLFKKVSKLLGTSGKL